MISAGKMAGKVQTKNLASLQNLRNGVEYPTESHGNGTVVIKPQFFSNFHIVNIDNVIPFMGNNNPQVTLSQGQGV